MNQPIQTTDEYCLYFLDSPSSRLCLVKFEGILEIFYRNLGTISIFIRNSIAAILHRRIVFGRVAAGTRETLRIGGDDATPNQCALFLHRMRSDRVELRWYTGNWRMFADEFCHHVDEVNFVRSYKSRLSTVGEKSRKGPRRDDVIGIHRQSRCRRYKHRISAVSFSLQLSGVDTLPDIHLPAALL